MKEDSDNEQEIFEDAFEHLNHNSSNSKKENKQSDGMANSKQENQSDDEFREDMKILLNQDGDEDSEYVEDILEKLEIEKATSAAKEKEKEKAEKEATEKLLSDAKSGIKNMPNVDPSHLSSSSETEEKASSKDCDNLNSSDNIPNDKEEAEKHESEFDEQKQKEKEALMTEEQKEGLRIEAQELKAEGNECFKNSEFEKAKEKYTQALVTCPLCYAKDRSIMYSNRGACKFREKNYETCVKDCTKALEINTNYLKALLRRADAYEKLENLEDALADYQKALEMDPSLWAAREACMRLPNEIKEKNEKLKEEMMGKLKELGNMILKPFGMSTDSFQFNQDPNTGSYSVNMNNQNGPDEKK